MALNTIKIFIAGKVDLSIDFRFLFVLLKVLFDENRLAISSAKIIILYQDGYMRFIARQIM